VGYDYRVKWHEPVWLEVVIGIGAAVEAQGIQVGDGNAQRNYFR
jgi:hypothetical protein